MPISLILTVLLILFVLTMLAKTVRVIPQGRAGIVERLGKFHAVLNPGLHIVIPVIDRVLPLIDLREQVVSFPSQSVITEDNLVGGSTPSCTSRSPTPARRPAKLPTTFAPWTS